MNIRYITEVRQRRILRDRLNRKLLSELEKVDNIKIASESIDIHVKEFPDYSTRRDKMESEAEGKH